MALPLMKIGCDAKNLGTIVVDSKSVWPLARPTNLFSRVIALHMARVRHALH